MMTPFLPMFCLLRTGDSSPAVRQVAANVSKLVSKLPDGSIKDGLKVALTDKEQRPILRKTIKEFREAKETAKLIDRKVKEMERRMKESLRNPDFPNIEDYGPKPKRRLDG